VKVWVPFTYRIERFSELPVEVEVFEAPDRLPSDPASVEFWAAPFLATGPVVAMVEQMPALRVIQLMSAGADAWIGRVPDGVTLCDARGVHSSSTAEWALAAILAYQRSFPAFIRSQAAGVWDRSPAPTAELSGRHVLIVGAGAIGDALARRLIACECGVTRVARHARDGVYGVADLPGLLPDADIVVLLLPLTTETTGMVDAAFLRRMKDGALLVNAARGPVVVTDDLLAEVRTGRLHAALDVTDPEPLSAGHPLWSLPNVLITPHVAGTVQGLLPRALDLVYEQLRRYLNEEPLINVVKGGY
jgi:phosphoglycerate dehydrogenase-like enzyme